MDDEKWPALPQDPGWVLEQIEMGAREAGVPLQFPPTVPRMPRKEIDSVVTRLLEEELARLEKTPEEP